MNVKFHRITSYTWNFQNFTCVFTILVKFDINFLGQLNNLIRERREELRGTHPPDSTGNIKDIWLAITQPSWEQKISEKI